MYTTSSSFRLPTPGQAILLCPVIYTGPYRVHKSLFYTANLASIAPNSVPGFLWNRSSFNPACASNSSHCLSVRSQPVKVIMSMSIIALSAGTPLVGRICSAITMRDDSGSAIAAARCRRMVTQEGSAQSCKMRRR